MSLTNPAGLWLLAMALPVIALHILRSRRTEVTVSSTFGWERQDRPVTATRPWQRLRWSLPLVLQLLVVGLVAVALAGPVLDTGRVSAERLVVLVDTSASMGATDGSPTRLAAARAEVERVVDELGAGATVTIISAGAPASVVASDIDPGDVSAPLEQLEVSEGGFDGEAASALALGLDQPDRSVDYVLVTDGGLTAAEVALLPEGTDARIVGRSDRNLGITNVVVADRGDVLHVQATVDNAGRDRATTVVRVDVDGVTAATTSVRVDGRASQEVGLDVPAGARLDVHLDSDDVLDLDDHVYAVGPDERTLQVVRLGGDNPFLDALLESAASVEVTRFDSFDQATGTAALDAADLLVIDGVAVPEAPTVPWLAIAPPGGAPGVTVDGRTEAPVAALVRQDNDLLAGLSFEELAIAEAQVIRAPAATTLLGAEATPLLVSGREGGVPFVYLGASLSESNLALLPSFPVLGERILAQLGGAELTSGGLSVGDPLPLDVGAEATVVSPSGTTTEVPAGGVPPALDRTGIWTVSTTGGATRSVVVNPPAAESDVAPARGLAIPGVRGELDGQGAPVQQSLLVAVVMAALALVAAEWWVAARRRGVPLRQWRVATVMRGVIVAALLGALIVPVLRLPSSTVATVFVLDVSDSMGAARADAVEQVADAIDRMPDGAVAGVVAVGGDARVDASVKEALRWTGPRVQVDGAATDLAAGVRIAGAIVPGDHARRVVLVSDGRPTTGDLDAEVARLTRAGVQLDVMPVATTSGPDVLVVGVDVADRARTSDLVRVRVRVSASVAQAAVVTLRRDGVEVDRRLVDLPAGASEVLFEQPAGAPGVVRWTATVAGPSNGIAENDAGRATTRIEDRALVLMVEGAPGEARELARAVGASGIGVQVVQPEELPDLAGLASVDAVVLVDVPASALSAAQVDDLVTATRDLGGGLLSLGGTSSYGAGDYLGSPLESLLPVISEVKDPKRRSKVAQVFAVDVSGSMGACHCAEDADGANSRLGGGVTKTDIARDAAVLALEGIAPTDELGVLALDDQHRWVLDLGPVGDGSEARRQLNDIDHGEGATDLEPGLSVSAERLRESDASLRHIVLFTDGFEDTARLAALAREAAELRDTDGITVSVMGTGEGAAQELRAIADAGGGRFYPGRDIQQLPDLLLEETKVVSRQLIVEGEFLPEITSSAPEVAQLDSAPAVRGYLATTLRPTATQHLRVGDEQDPLLASWQVGLGRVTSWTSDAGARWAGGWTAWEGAPTFWADVLRSVIRAPQGSVQVRFDTDRAEVTAAFDQPVPDGAQVVAKVTDPSGSARDVTLDRVDERTYRGEFVGGDVGTYGVGVTATGADGRAVGAVSGTAELGYSREYAGEPTDTELLETISVRTGGRGSITPTQAFERGELDAGRRAVDLRWWLLLLAALLWPLTLAVSRLRRTAGPDALVRLDSLGSVGSAVEGLRRGRTNRAGRSPSSEPSVGPPQHPPTDPPSSPPPAPPAASPPSATAPPGPPAQGAGEGVDGASPLDSLLEAKRRRRNEG